jgi:hypothetical protein
MPTPRLRSAVLLLALLAVACRAPVAAGVEFEPARRIRLAAPDSAGTLAIDAGGRLWRGAPGWAEPIDAHSGVGGARIETGGTDVPHFLGTADGRVYLRAGDRLLTADTATGQIIAARREAGVVALATDGRYVYLATATGAVFGLGPRSLLPRWAWPRLGAPALALASSPAGDRLFVALADTTRPRAPGTTLLSRDAQTGRTEGEVAIDGAVTELAAAPEGWIFAATWAEDAGALIALRPAGSGTWEVAWRRRAAALGQADGPLLLRLSPLGDRLAVSSRAGGVRLLDARSGEAVGHAETGSAPLDAARGADGALYILQPTEIVAYTAASAR